MGLTGIAGRAGFERLLSISDWFWGSAPCTSPQFASAGLRRERKALTALWRCDLAVRALGFAIVYKRCASNGQQMVKGLYFHGVAGCSLSNARRTDAT